MPLARTRGSVAALAATAVAVISFSSPAAATPTQGHAARTTLTGQTALPAQTARAAQTLPLRLDGTPVSFTIPDGGGDTELTFYGRAGQSVMLICSDGADGFSPYGFWQVIAPDGSTVSSRSMARATSS